MAKLEAYLHIEETLTVLLDEAWQSLASSLVQSTAKLVGRGELDAAEGALEALSAGEAFNALRPRLTELAVASMLFGAGNTGASVRSTALAGAKVIPEAVFDAIDQLLVLVNDGLIQRAKSEARAVIDAVRQPASVVDLTKAAGPALAARFNAQVMGTGRAVVDVTANLITSRLTTFGFLAEAREKGIPSYQISAVLDKRTCPVCRLMHGKVFKIDDGYERLLQALKTKDVEALKNLHPWPAQDKKSLTALYAMGAEDLVSRGYNVPPFHPKCRCLLVQVGTVTEEVAALPGSVVLPSSALATGQAAAAVASAEVDGSAFKAVMALDGAALEPLLSDAIKAVLASQPLSTLSIPQLLELAHTELLKTLSEKEAKKALKRLERKLLDAYAVSGE